MRKNILNLEKSCNFVTKCLKRLLDAISLLQNLLQTVTKIAESVTNGLWTPFVKMGRKKAGFLAPSCLKNRQFHSARTTNALQNRASDRKVKLFLRGLQMHYKNMRAGRVLIARWCDEVLDR